MPSPHALLGLCPADLSGRLRQGRTHFSPSPEVAVWGPPFPQPPRRTPTSFRWVATGAFPPRSRREAGGGRRDGGAGRAAAQAGSGPSWPEGAGTLRLSLQEASLLAPNSNILEMRLDQASVFTLDPGGFVAADASISPWKTLGASAEENSPAL